MVPPCAAEDELALEDEDDANDDVVRRRTTVDGRIFAFADTERIKRKVRKRVKIRSPPYNVHDQYHKAGCCQAIARNPYFESFTLAVIVVNAIWIAIDTDWNDAVTLLDATPVFIVADCIFFAYFSFELGVRFGAFKYKRSCLKDAWFVFDSSLVTLYLLDPFMITFATAMSSGQGLNLPTSLLRLFRLARLSRLVRMMRSLPELMIMVKGMVSAAASVSYMLGLLVIVTYIFAIAMTQLSIDTQFHETYFKGVALSMYTLFIYGTFLDSLNGFADAVREESSVCLAVLTVFLVVSALTLLNMLVGVLCEVVSAIAKIEREQMLTEKVCDKFGKIVADLDTNENGLISWPEVASMAEHPDAFEILATVNINLIDMVEIAEDFIFAGGNRQRELTFEDFMAMALDCRSSQTAVMRDVTVLRKRFNKKMSDLQEAIGGVEYKLNTLIERSATQQPWHSKALDGSNHNLSKAAAPEAASARSSDRQELSMDALAEGSGDTQTLAASTKIQATFRGHRTRCQLDTLREAWPATSKDTTVMSVNANRRNLERVLTQTDEEAWSCTSVTAMLLEVEHSAHSGSCNNGLSVEHLCRMASAELEHLRQHDEVTTQIAVHEAARHPSNPSPNTSEMLAEEQARLLAEPPPPCLPGQMANAEELL